MLDWSLFKPQQILLSSNEQMNIKVDLLNAELKPCFFQSYYYYFLFAGLETLKLMSKRKSWSAVNKLA